MKANAKAHIQTLEIQIYSVTDEHIIPMLPIGNYQSLETQEFETEEGSIYSINLKAHFYNNEGKPTIKNYIKNQLLPSLKRVIKETSGDDSYFDYTPDYTQQVYQLLYLAHNAGIINTDDLNSILGNIQSWLWEIYNENPSDCPKYDLEEYSKYSNLCYLKITKE